MPVLPMVLVNGTEGIGTGWSTSIPTYNPTDIINVLRAKIGGEEIKGALHPWYACPWGCPPPLRPPRTRTQPHMAHVHT
jgi:DNA topoisomerase-2